MDLIEAIKTSEINNMLIKEMFGHLQKHKRKNILETNGGGAHQALCRAILIHVSRKWHLHDATRGHLIWDYLTFLCSWHSYSDLETFDHNLGPYIIFCLDNRHKIFFFMHVV